MNWATYIKFMNKIEMFTRKKENTGIYFIENIIGLSMTLVVLLLIQASIIV